MSRERDRWCPRKSLLHLPCITESYAPSSPLASYTSPYVREHQVGLSSVLSLSSLSPSTGPYMCVWREKECWSCTHTLSLSLTVLHTQRDTDTHHFLLLHHWEMDPFHNGLEILLPFALDGPSSQACICSQQPRNDRLLFVQDYTRIYTPRRP